MRDYLWQDVNVDSLVKDLKKDNLFKVFDGYGVTARDENSRCYYVSREQEHAHYHMVDYSPKRTKYIRFYNLFEDEKLGITKKLNSKDSIDILNKAHELITIVKKLNIRWAGGENGYFECSFNDGTRMRYVKNKNELDADFYRFFKNIKWVDSNFVTFE